MANNTILTASHIRYLLALKQLLGENGIRSIDIAKNLNLSKVRGCSLTNKILGTLKRMNPPYGVFRPSDFESKNSPQDCFFNASHPLRVRIPF